MSSLSFKNNNPGNLRPSAFTESRGAIAEGGYAHFPTIVQGLAAMVDLLASVNYRKLTILEAINRYAPSSDNNRPREYAGFIAHRAAVTPDTVLGSMDPFQLLRVVEAMVRFEGWVK